MSELLPLWRFEGRLWRRDWFSWQHSLVGWWSQKRLLRVGTILANHNAYGWCRCGLIGVQLSRGRNVFLFTVVFQFLDNLFSSVCEHRVPGGRALERRAKGVRASIHAYSRRRPNSVRLLARSKSSWIASSCIWSWDIKGSVSLDWNRQICCIHWTRLPFWAPFPCLPEVERIVRSHSGVRSSGLLVEKRERKPYNNKIAAILIYRTIGLYYGLI